MYRKYVTRRIREFEARIREEADKVLRNWDEDGRCRFENSVFANSWTKARQRMQWWSEVAKGY